MSLNRRAILALFGGAAVAPAVGAKTAASALGLETALVAGSGINVLGAPAPMHDSWWGSPLQISMDARERTMSEMAHSTPYPHMKSWGRGFRMMVSDKDNRILMMYRQKMHEDASFREKVLAALGVVK